ncbi:hypothetical protein BESB_068680 [Besnoitia besnoiti]|uniref:HhH-GPD domain-containing protein n=1 Tax=Besnoitia besnoiti TaxID=94643 RepID=A0A2A9MA18_BESBE|nr:hypothetical protein BESB_068680 [Besnoitia besnoiti]PFH34835.1 hypothetical protein BESB_068680 [Besnoitia besnoiti]
MASQGNPFAAFTFQAAATPPRASPQSSSSRAGAFSASPAASRASSSSAHLSSPALGRPGAHTPARAARVEGSETPQRCCPRPASLYTAGSQPLSPGTLNTHGEDCRTSFGETDSAEQAERVKRRRVASPAANESHSSACASEELASSSPSSHCRLDDPQTVEILSSSSRAASPSPPAPSLHLRLPQSAARSASPGDSSLHVASASFSFEVSSSRSSASGSILSPAAASASSSREGPEALTSCGGALLPRRAESGSEEAGRSGEGGDERLVEGNKSAADTQTRRRADAQAPGEGEDHASPNARQKVGVADSPNPPGSAQSPAGGPGATWGTSPASVGAKAPKSSPQERHFLGPLKAKSRRKPLTQKSSSSLPSGSPNAPAFSASKSSPAPDASSTGVAPSPASVASGGSGVRPSGGPSQGQCGRRKKQTRRAPADAGTDPPPQRVSPASFSLADWIEGLPRAPQFVSSSELLQSPNEAAAPPGWRRVLGSLILLRQQHGYEAQVDEFYQYLVRLNRFKEPKFLAVVAGILSIRCRDPVALRAMETFIKAATRHAISFAMRKSNASPSSLAAPPPAPLSSADASLDASAAVSLPFSAAEARRAAAAAPSGATPEDTPEEAELRKKFEEEGPTCTVVQHMAQAEIEASISCVNFKASKAERILLLAQTLVRTFRSRVPSTYEELLKLPGVGPTMANLLLTLHYGRNEAPRPQTLSARFLRDKKPLSFIPLDDEGLLALHIDLPEAFAASSASQAEPCGLQAARADGRRTGGQKKEDTGGDLGTTLVRGEASGGEQREGSAAVGAGTKREEKVEEAEGEEAPAPEETRGRSSGGLRAAPVLGAETEETISLELDEPQVFQLLKNGGGLFMDMNMSRAARSFKWLSQDDGADLESARKALEKWVPPGLYLELPLLLTTFIQLLCGKETPKCSVCWLADVCIHRQRAAQQRQRGAGRSLSPSENATSGERRRDAEDEVCKRRERTARRMGADAEVASLVQSEGSGGRGVIAGDAARETQADDEKESQAGDAEETDEKEAGDAEEEFPQARHRGVTCVSDSDSSVEECVAREDGRAGEQDEEEEEPVMVLGVREAWE